MATTEGHITLEEGTFERVIGRSERSDAPEVAHTADLTLIARCLNGEAAACSELYHRYYRQVMPICMRYARGMEEAKDILQDSFTRAFSHLHSYTGKGSFIGWLKRVTLNTAINHYHATAAHRSTVRARRRSDEPAHTPRPRSSPASP